MASPAAIGAALKLLASVFAGEISREKVVAYAAALNDVSDEQIAASVEILIRTHTGQFLPVPAQIREACGANDRPAIDVEAIIRQIGRLAPYSPNGSYWPRVEVVRKGLGNAVADAYGMIGGGSRLFADSPTTRDIAERDFMLALRTETGAEDRRSLPSGKRTPLLKGEWTP